MAKSKRRLQEAANRFRRENLLTYKLYGFLISRMADFIREKGAAEVTITTTTGECYESRN
jgi:hypothetical protein